MAAENNPLRAVHTFRASAVLEVTDDKNNMIKVNFVFWYRTLGFVLVATLLTACSAPPPAFLGTALEFPEEAPGFSLLDHQGGEFQLGAQKGKIVLLFFGFINCPDVCPMTMLSWTEASGSLGADGKDIRFVFITVDPERDTAENLADYSGVYGNRMLTLRGSAEALEAVYKSYGIYREVEANAGSENYSINHANSIIVIDKQGRWRLNFPRGMTAESMLHDLNILLSE